MRNARSKVRTGGFMRPMVTKFLGVVLGVLGCLACGRPGESESVGGASELPADRFHLSCGAPDQFNLYLPPLPNSAPVDLLIVPQDYSREELRAFSRAVEGWNHLHQSIYGVRLFRLREWRGPEYSPADLLGCRFDSGNSQVPIFRVASTAAWAAAGLTPASPAVTLRCRNEVGGLGKQALLLNASARGPSKAEQFESIVLHELGHVIGLGHSCETSAGVEGARCDSTQPNHSYRQAVMYPFLDYDRRSNRAQIKETLTENDQARAQCIWSARR